MSISNPNYKNYSFAHHGEVYKILEDVFSKNNIQYYLIGANARDVQLYKAGIKPTRGTADIDFAIMVPDFDIYTYLFDELHNLGFRKTEETYRLIFDKTNTILDLMPYGQIEQDYTVSFTERDITLSVLGFQEVGEFSELVTIQEENYELPVTPVEGILILKLISWNEKPEYRTKDLEDISFLINHAWELYENEAYQHHLDLFNDHFEVTIVSARIIGRKMQPILQQNMKLYNTITSILERAIVNKQKAENPEIILAQQMGKSIEEVQTLLSYIILGIRDT